MPEININDEMQYSLVPSLGATPSLLGFGAMRLPLGPSGDPADVDVETTCKMVDAAIAGGVNYFDTAYAYHKEKSEDALRRALVERYDRGSFYLADKLATFLCKSEGEQA
ncbi:aldo/keto reductase, partial [Synergistaceae bacterium OttesenSCG-928-I11]|nr:aldo/keto reductase [Synergistaceae bacterium OttesenSCG-928-I11]